MCNSGHGVPSYCQGYNLSGQGQHLDNMQPSLGITEQDILCVQIAGLCHDLGHGPFSHLFDARVLPQLGAKNFCHEHASVQLFELLVKENNLDSLFASYGLKAAEIHFIQELILGDYEQSIGMQPSWDWVGPLETNKKFLFDIVKATLDDHFF